MHMKTTDDFRQFFRDQLSKELASAESARKKTILRGFLVWIGAIALGIAAIWGLGKWSGGEHIVGIVILVVLVFGFLAYMVWKEVLSDRHFYNLFKGRVIDGIVRFVDERLHYIPHRYVPPAVLVQSRLFAKPIHQYEGDDYCFMQLDNGIFLEFSEVHAKTIEKENGKKQAIPIFDGLFAHLKFTEPRVGDLYILPKGMTEADLYQPGRLTQYTTGNPEFDQHFVVYVSSQAVIRRYVTPQFIQAILEFRREYPDRRFLLAMHGKEVYLGVFCKSHFFEPDVWRPLTNVESLEQFFTDINSLMRLLHAIADLSGLPLTAEAAQPA